MGMDHRAYYMSWVITHTITNVIQALLIVSFGYILNFNLFIKTDFSILFFTMFLPCMSFTALAFLISAFFRKGLDASNVCLVVFLLAYNAADILSALIFESGEETNNSWKWFFTYLPISNAPVGFLVMLNQGMRASSDGKPGLRWADRTRDITSVAFNEDGSPSNAFWTMEMTMIHMVLFSLICTIVAVYIDMIMPNGYGKSRSFFFCFKCFRLQAARSTGDTKYRESIDAEGSSDDPDVVAEAKRVKEGTADGRDIAVELIGLSKVFHGGDLRAVDSISYGVDDNSLFVLLGHNWGGKTTTSNMLVGNMASWW